MALRVKFGRSTTGRKQTACLLEIAMLRRRNIEKSSILGQKSAKNVDFSPA